MRVVFALLVIASLVCSTSAFQLVVNPNPVHFGTPTRENKHIIVPIHIHNPVADSAFVLHDINVVGDWFHAVTRQFQPCSSLALTTGDRRCQFQVMVARRANDDGASYITGHVSIKYSATGTDGIVEQKIPLIALGSGNAAGGGDIYQSDAQLGL